jgi:hypothetical protein
MALLDHVVINTRFGVDAAEALFASLGFRLTPRGHHDLGSMNHNMMPEGAYLEIVGVPETGRQRQEVLDSPLGLSGIVVKSHDADETFARLVEAGFDPLPPMDLARPVTIGGVEHMARFRNVRMKPDFYPGGRIYFSHHLTPELVWRPEWQEHRNGFRAIDRVEVESPTPEATAEGFALVFGADYAPGTPCRVILEDSEIHVFAGPVERMRATGITCDDLDAVATGAARAGAQITREDAGTLAVALPGLETTLLCRAAA